MKVMARLFRRFVRECLLKAIEVGEVAVDDEHSAPMRRASFETKWFIYASALELTPRPLRPVPFAPRYE